MSLASNNALITGCCKEACYIDGNGERYSFTSKAIYIRNNSGGFDNVGEIVEDDQGQPVDPEVYKPIDCEIKRSVCGFRMPDGHWWLTDQDAEFIADECSISYKFYSIVVNGTEKLTGGSVGFSMDVNNINFVTVGPNQTYSNMVDFLNAWAAANCPDYEFVIPDLSDDTSYGVFGIVSPDGDTFSIKLDKSGCGTGSQLYEWRDGGVGLWDGQVETNYNGFKCASEQAWYDEGFLT